MKILIVFTTHNSGSKEKYEGTWGCIDEKYGFRYKIINNKQAEIYVFKGSRFYDKASKDWQYSRIVERLKNTVKKYDGAVFTVLFHATEQKDMLCEKLKKDKSIEALITSGKLLIKEYSSAIDPTWSHHISSFCDNPADIGDKFDSLWSFLWENALLRETHSLFLPLDIDMQALEILAKKKENGVKVKDPKEYLEEMYADNIDYVQKLKDLQAKVNTIGEIEGINDERLRKLDGISNENVDQFFKKLGGKKNDPDEFLDHSWGIDGVNSFHDWYCALALCLGGAEGDCPM